jgi:hypothetical protein
MSIMDLVNLKHDKEKAFKHMLPNVHLLNFLTSTLGYQGSR